MDKKTRTSIARLQRIVDAERPSDEERERVADQLLTQDQLRRIDPRLDKAGTAPSRPSRKRPPTARDLPRQARAAERTAAPAATQHCHAPPRLAAARWS